LSGTTEYLRYRPGIPGQHAWTRTALQPRCNARFLYKLGTSIVRKNNVSEGRTSSHGGQVCHLVDVLFWTGVEAAAADASSSAARSASALVVAGGSFSRPGLSTSSVV